MPCQDEIERRLLCALGVHLPENIEHLIVSFLYRGEPPFYTSRYDYVLRCCDCCGCDTCYVPPWVMCGPCLAGCHGGEWDYDRKRLWFG